MRYANQLMLSIVLGGLGIYFSVLNGRGLLRYAQFRVAIAIEDVLAGGAPVA